MESSISSSADCEMRWGGAFRAQTLNIFFYIDVCLHKKNGIFLYREPTRLLWNTQHVALGGVGVCVKGRNGTTGDGRGTV